MALLTAIKSSYGGFKYQSDAMFYNSGVSAAIVFYILCMFEVKAKCVYLFKHMFYL